MSKTSMNSFDQATRKALKHYVYCLVDPRNDEIFYVGKGWGNRVFNHKHKPGDEDKHDADSRLGRIREIEDAGKDVGRYILCYGLERDAAFAAEGRLIALMQSGLVKNAKLANQIGGHNAADVLSTNAIQARYGLPVLQKSDFEHPVMIVNISRTRANFPNDYEAARGNWTASEAKLRGLLGKHYVIAEWDGVFVDIFKPKSWEKLDNDGGRVRFENEPDFMAGNKERDGLYERYCNKRNGFHKRGDRRGFHYINM